MPATKELRVYIVEDNPLVLRGLRDTFERVPGVTVVGEATDGETALREVPQLKPDYVSLDVVLPKMSGLEVMKKLKEAVPRTRILLVTGSMDGTQEALIRALRLGAFDFFSKSDRRFFERIGTTIESLRRPVYSPPEGALNASSPARGSCLVPRKKARPAVIAIGVSTGGPQALSSFFRSLSPAERTPILIVQHMPATFTTCLAKALDRDSHYTVLEAQDGMSLEPGKAYLAPGNYHMVVEGGTRGARVRVNQEPPLDSFRPSVNKLFDSVATSFGPAAVGVILTGMGEDGATGLLKIKEAGGYTLAQDEQTSAVFGMPKKAIDIGAASMVCPLPGLAQAVLEVTQVHVRRGEQCGITNG